MKIMIYCIVTNDNVFFHLILSYKTFLSLTVNAQNLADKSIIVIPNAHAADAGTYKCTARNQYENDTATTIVSITGEYLHLSIFTN